MATSLHTSLCDLLGIRFPFVKAGMGGGTDTPELAAAVSAAGGLGLFGAILLDPDQLRAGVRRIRTLTDRPIGVNLVVHPPQPDGRDRAALDPVLAPLRQAFGLPTSPVAPPPPPMAPLSDLLRVIAEERVPVVNTMGDPRSLAAAIRETGASLLPIVTTVDEALQAVEAGAAALVAQGAEAGGLRGGLTLGSGGEAAQVGTMALVPAIVDAVPDSVPVIAAGGIMDGRGVAAALTLGAGGVLLGTRFAAAREAGIGPNWRARLLAAVETDAVVSRAATGRPARALRNRLVETVVAGDRAGTPPLAYPHQAVAIGDLVAAGRERDEPDLLYIAAGQGVRALREEEGAAEIVARLVRETEAVLERMSHSYVR
jgi:nitronate monooxygenase